MNLAKMRAERTSRTLIDYARAHPQLLWYADQDAFNVACRGRWLHLHPRWNVQTTMLVLPVETLPLPREQVLAARAQPAVIHYIGPWKPWTYMCRHPLQHLYFEHARATPWGAPALQGRTLRNVVLRPLPMRVQEAWFELERWVKRKWAGLRRRLTA
jgi:lipopolysaccharide biosynthesis glycosyltransferase